MTEEAFLRAIREAPDDPAPRLIFADWLEEQGDPRCEIIRLYAEYREKGGAEGLDRVIELARQCGASREFLRLVAPLASTKLLLWKLTTGDGLTFNFSHFAESLRVASESLAQLEQAATREHLISGTWRWASPGPDHSNDRRPGKQVKKRLRKAERQRRKAGRRQR